MFDESSCLSIDCKIWAVFSKFGEWETHFFVNFINLSVYIILFFSIGTDFQSKKQCIFSTVL